MPRPQFTIKTLFWLTLCVAMFLGGMAAQYRIAGLQATEREKKLEAAIALLRRHMKGQAQQLRALDDELLELKLGKIKNNRAPSYRESAFDR